jgi:hypothetical protein
MFHLRFDLLLLRRPFVHSSSSNRPRLLRPTMKPTQDSWDPCFKHVSYPGP